MATEVYVKQVFKSGGLKVSKDKDLKDSEEIRKLPFFNPKDDEMKSYILSSIKWKDKILVSADKQKDGNYRITELKKLESGYTSNKYGSNKSTDNKSYSPKSNGYGKSIETVQLECDSRTLNSCIMTAGSIVTSLINNGEKIDANTAGEILVALTKSFYNELNVAEEDTEENKEESEIEEPEVVTEDIPF